MASSCSEWTLNLFLLVVGLFVISSTADTVLPPPERAKNSICIGTSGALSVPANRTNHFLNLQERYQYCTYVDGNLEITWLRGKSLDLSFLKNIREVTGYVLISFVDVPRLILPSLQIIRGRTLFTLSAHEKKFALMISRSTVEHLEMPALRDILDGSVGVFNSAKLCHIRTINWEEILTGPNAVHLHDNSSALGTTCPPCHSSCSAGCWGPSPEHCQELSKVNCSPQCHGGRCFGPEPRQCCHLFCAGGCTGPTQSECLACRNFDDNGVCKQECPSMMRYDPINYSWKPNPDGKFAYGATCVNQCPSHLLKDSSACVRVCPHNKHALNGACVPCNGACPKTCKLPDDSKIHTPVHAGNIELLRNCTILQGSLVIHEHSFDGFQEFNSDFSFGPRHPKMPVNRLEALSSLREITGYVYIDAKQEDFTDLSFLRNLQVVGGRYKFEVYYSIYIAKTSLRSLQLHSLREISSGSVKIVENSDLCFADDINWSGFLARGNKIEHPDFQTVVEKNRNRTICNSEGKICDDQCGSDGCWGSGSNSCISCRKFSASGNCVESCDHDQGLFQSSNTTCGVCDEQCAGPCSGPGPRSCAQCRHVRDGPVCRSTCPLSKYSRAGECQPCHANCVRGCRGPANTVGAVGCNSCESAVINNSGHVEYCLAANESCPIGYYREFVGPQLTGSLQPLSGKSICRRCHPRCLNCTAYGFHLSVCLECSRYRSGEQCVDQCPLDHYTDEVRRECIPCAEECRGCTGPGNQCTSCRNYRVYTDGADGTVNSSAFLCTAQCPSTHQHKILSDSSREPYCSTQPGSLRPLLASSPAGSDDWRLRTSAGVAVASILLLVAAGLACKFRVTRRKQQQLMRLTLMMARDATASDEPLKVTDARPNLAQLRIVPEAELRRGGVLGYGAFGTVYKGVWMPEQRNVKVPVAIKVLREGSGADSNKEILDEAYLMASVEHANLLPLLAVCMTSQLMLVTQLMPLGCLLEYVRRNSASIGSKALLNWCTQIARGMAYLEQRRLVHRDLAARNVLVQNPGLVKITDFGLAKMLDTNEQEYRAVGGKMPIKWLALECIQHRVFTHKSDVWAYGVTVWELLTLGGRPYDNVSAKDVPDLLEKGDRLPQPACCSIELYMLLVTCWLLDTDSRPTFLQLVDRFAAMSRDPGRYLVISGDHLMRLPPYYPRHHRPPPPQPPQLREQREMGRGSGGGTDYIDCQSTQCDSAAATTTTATSGAGMAGVVGGCSMAAECKSKSVYSGIRNALHGFDNAAMITENGQSCQAALKSVEDRDGHTSPASGARSAPSWLLQLPVDEQDYLVPSGGSTCGTNYVHLSCSTSNSVIAPTKLDWRSQSQTMHADNPEYHLYHSERFSPSIIVKPPTPSYGYLSPEGGVIECVLAGDSQPAKRYDRVRVTPTVADVPQVVSSSSSTAIATAERTVVNTPDFNSALQNHQISCRTERKSEGGCLVRGSNGDGGPPRGVWSSPNSIGIPVVVVPTTSGSGSAVFATGDNSAGGSSHIGSCSDSRSMLTVFSATGNETTV